jgi:hypothetical protein
MNVQGKDNAKELEEGHQLLNVSLMQGGALPDNRAYLDGCSTVTDFKTDKYLKNLETVKQGIKINCNAVVMTTNQKGTYRQLNVWYVPNRIANIFSMHELEQHYRITYNSWVGYYSVHVPKGIVKFYKDKQGLLYINLKGSSQEAATMLMQVIQMQGAQECISGAVMSTCRWCTELRGVQQAKDHASQASKKGASNYWEPKQKILQRDVSNHLVATCPITHVNITNAHQIFGPDLASIWEKTVQQMLEPVLADYVEV